MDINIHQLLVSLFLLVPGFISTEIQKAFVPKRYETDFQWVIASLLISLLMNAILVLVFIIFGDFQTNINLSEVSTTISGVKLQTSVGYIVILYIGAVGWGYLSGSNPVVTLKGFLHWIGKTPYASNPSVWNRIFEVQRPSDKPVTWLKYKYEGNYYLAHLRHTNSYIDPDKSFEVYVDSVHVYENGNWVPLVATHGDNENANHGMYFRITTEFFVELYFKDKQWSPNM